MNLIVQLCISKRPCFSSGGGIRHLVQLFSGVMTSRLFDPWSMRRVLKRLLTNSRPSVFHSATQNGFRQDPSCRYKSPYAFLFPSSGSLRYDRSSFAGVADKFNSSPVTTESLTLLFDKLSRKKNPEFNGKRVGPGWLKYEWSGSVWNLDDGALQCLFISVTVMEPSADGDYAIFQWRQNGSTDPPIVYLKDPLKPLPSESSYRNPSFYLFHPDHTVPVQPRPQSASPSAPNRKHSSPHDSVPKHKKEFEDFHNSNGVRTVTGSIGPVKNGMGTMISSGMSS